MALLSDLALVKDEITQRGNDFWPVFGLYFPRLVVLCVLPAPVKLVNLLLSLALNLRTEQISQVRHFVTKYVSLGLCEDPNVSKNTERLLIFAKCNSVRN